MSKIFLTFFTDFLHLFASLGLDIVNSKESLEISTFWGKKVYFANYSLILKNFINGVWYDKIRQKCWIFPKINFSWRYSNNKVQYIHLTLRKIKVWIVKILFIYLNTFFQNYCIKCNNKYIRHTLWWFFLLKWAKRLPFQEYKKL